MELLHDFLSLEFNIFVKGILSNELGKTKGEFFFGLDWKFGMLGFKTD